jgi:hypothetical protein
LVDAGYSNPDKYGRGGNPPDAATEQMALRLAYAEIAREQGSKAAKPKPKLPVADNGRGGAGVSRKVTRGTLDDIAAEMTAEGKVR